MQVDDVWGYETREEGCPYCGAVPFEPCINLRRSGVGESGTGMARVGYISRVRTKRVHPERRHS